MYLHHDGSPLYVSNAAPRLGEFISLRLRTHRDHQPESVALRTVHDGEPFVVVAEEKESFGVDVWWVVTVQARNVVTHYRWLLSGGAYSYAWLNASGLVDHDVPDADDFVVAALPAPPAWARHAVVYQVFPDRFARRQGTDQESPRTEQYGEPVPDWAQPRPWSARPDGRSSSTPVEFYGGDLDGVREHLDHLEALGANTLYLTPVFPARSTHRYDASSFAEVDPLLGGDQALADLNHEAHRRGLRVIGDITLNHCGRAHDWFVRAQDPQAPER
ncbi:MAG: alpha-amylase family glycosyl hydrolase, partial [Candidatus Nanopelagicales bacterium]|nr:alpha-amylase family glycosyl hydrolase [Candidatus Nanopelagicales bacterium]